VLAESEPNDDGATAAGQSDFATFDADGPISSYTVIRGAVGVPGDEDVYRIENPGDVPRVVRASQYGSATLGGCLVGLSIMLRDGFGQLLAQNGAGSDACRTIEATVPARGVIYLHVATRTDTTAVPLYHAVVELR
jgi:hypothetical protein